MYIYVITMIAAALTIYFSHDEYKKGSMSTHILRSSAYASVSCCSASFIFF